jgi:hypothetical protein
MPQVIPPITISRFIRVKLAFITPNTVRITINPKRFKGLKMVKAKVVK